MTDTPPLPEDFKAFKTGRVLWVLWRSLMKDLGVLVFIFPALLALAYAIIFLLPALAWFAPPLIYLAGASTLTHLALNPHYVALEDAIGVGRRAWLTVFLTVLVGTVAMFISFQLMAIPGILIAALLIVAVPVVMAERPGPKGTLQRCAQLILPVLPPALGIVLLGLIIVALGAGLALLLTEIVGVPLRFSGPAIITAGVIVLTYLMAAIYIVRTVPREMYIQALAPSNS